MVVVVARVHPRKMGRAFEMGKQWMIDRGGLGSGRIAPSELCLVAAHHSDLAAARLRPQTAYVDRPQEYGGRRAPDADASEDWEWSTDGLAGLADLLGC